LAVAIVAQDSKVFYSVVSVYAIHMVKCQRCRLSSPFDYPAVRTLFF